LHRFAAQARARWAGDDANKDGGQGDGGDRGVGASVERITRLVALVFTEPESNP
jgi:hypothetical protein